MLLGDKKVSKFNLAVEKKVWKLPPPIIIMEPIEEEPVDGYFYHYDNWDYHK